jgi:hypothetical protein
MIACLHPEASAQSVPSESPCYVDHRLSQNDLEGPSLRMLTLMRNAPFARAGYEFETEWIDQHFRSHDWYEPGDFDPDSISARDDHNATLLRQYEENLSLKELRARRRAHWEQKGGVPEHGWLPSVWENADARREALLLSEAIAKRSDSLRAGIPWGFGGDFRLGASVEALPETVDRPANGVSWVQDNLADSLLGDWGPRVAIYLDSTDHIEQVVAEVRMSSFEPVGDGDYARLRSEVREIIDRLGPPTDPGNYREWGTAETVRPVRWEAGSHVAEVWPVFGCCLAQDAFLSIHTDAPDRMCGPEDGFREWFAAFERVLAEGAADRLANFYRFPFEDESGPPFANPSIRERYERVFESRAEFLKEVPNEHPIASTNERVTDGPWAVGLAENPRTGCTPYRGHFALADGPGEYVFHQVNGEWKATGIE